MSPAGRPSLAAERTEQVVAATVRCIERDGLSGISLERISQESGLSRSHIRHYLGSRDALMELAWGRIAEAGVRSIAMTAPTDLSTLAAGRPAGVDIWELLIEASRDPAIAPLAAGTLARIEAVVTELLERDAVTASAVVDRALGRAARRRLTRHQPASAAPAPAPGEAT